MKRSGSSAFDGLSTKIEYLYRGLGARRACWRIAQELLRPLYCRVTYSVLVREVRDDEPYEQRLRHPADLDYRAVSTPRSLAGFQVQMPVFLLKRLHDYLAGGANRFVILVRRLRPNGVVPQVVGFRTCQRGTFRAAGMQVRLSSDTLFIDQTEVLPEHRGQRILQFLGDATLAHCRRKGIRKICGSIRSDNLPSLRAHMRDAGNVVVGTIELVETLGGLFRRVAPESVVQQMIEGRAYKLVNGGLGASGVQPSGIRKTSEGNGRSIAFVVDR